MWGVRGGILSPGVPLYDASATAVIRDIVPATRLTTANGWLYAAEDGAQDLAAPPLAAALFTLAIWLPFLADAASFAVSAVLIWDSAAWAGAAMTDTNPIPAAMTAARRLQLNRPPDR